jgi:ATP-dependent DNA helicase RecG
MITKELKHIISQGENQRIEFKLSFTNPGKLMGGLSVEKIKTGNYVSVHRNKLLTEAFYLTGDIEKYGTGFRRVNNWFIEYPELIYDLKELSGFMQLVVKSKNVTDNVTDDRLRKIIGLISKNNTISTIELSKFFNVSKRTILRDIDKLKKQNIIRRIGNEKTGYWQIIKNE